MVPRAPSHAGSTGSIPGAGTGGTFAALLLKKKEIANKRNLQYSVIQGFNENVTEAADSHRIYEGQNMLVHKMS